MEHNTTYQCDSCGDVKEMPTHWGNHSGDNCSHCNDGSYRKVGESYDQEWVDEQKYNERQDREYEDRHRHDGRYC